jgi:hypothetical protein
MKEWVALKWASLKPSTKQVLQNAIFILIAIDQTLGMILGFIMHPSSTELFPDETLSSRCGRLGHRHPYKFWRALIDLMFRWQGPNHCVNAYRPAR